MTVSNAANKPDAHLLRVVLLAETLVGKVVWVADGDTLHTHPLRSRR